MPWAKVKTVLLIILGITVIILTMGLWDPFKIRKPKNDPTPEFEKERELNNAKTDKTIYKDLADLGSSKSGIDRDNKLKDLLDEDYPGSK